MEKAYSRIKWENYPSIATPLNETNLNKMDSSLDEVDNRVLGLDTAKLDKAVANSMVKEITFDEATGIFTITSLDGTTKTVDTKLEKVATNFSYDYETQKLKLTLLDGTEQEIDMSTLISQYEFADTSTIGFTVGNEGKITAIVKDGSITEDKLQPNFLADIKVEVAKGKSYSDSSYENATTSSNASKEAKQYRDEAKQYRDEVQAVADVDIATTEKAGLVKPDGTTITVDADGTIHSLGGQGTVDYTELENKPSINGTELEGNKTLDDLGIASKTKVETLETELEKTTYKVDTVIANVDLNIKDTATGEELHLVDTTEGKAVEYSLYGKARQNTTSGKNLLPYPYYEKTHTDNGITWTDNGDGTVTANGTATALSSFLCKARISPNGLVLPNGTYKISGCPSGGSNATYVMGANVTVNGANNPLGLDTGNGATITVNGDDYYTDKANVGIYFEIKNGTKVENLVFKPMVKLASIADDTYEPYTNGVSPNPSYPQEIEVSGESYNLIPYPYYETTQTEQGITFTDNGDGTITANGTATGLSNFFFIDVSKPMLLKAGSYILSGCQSGGSVNSTYFMLLGDVKDGVTTRIASDVGNGASFTIEEDKYIWVMARYEKNATANNHTFKPMIRKASVKNERYMPYGKGSVEVTSKGKNLLKNIATTQTKNGIEFVVNEDKSVTVNGTVSSGSASLIINTPYYLKKGSYILSGCPSGGGIETYRLHAYHADSNNTSYVGSDVGKGYAFNADVDGYYNISIRIGANVPMSNHIFKPMIRVATDTDDTYQPYKETISTIPTENGLAGIKVSSNGNYTDQNGQQWICDEVVKYADGSGAYTKKVESYSVTEETSISGFAVLGKCARGRIVKDNITSDPQNHNALSNIFRYIVNYTTDEEHFYCDENGIYVFAPTDELTTQDASGLKTWLISKNAEFIYILAQPITTPLTAEELAEISTFYPVTNISNDFDCGMKVKYNCDTKNYIDNKLAMLTTAMVNNI